MPATSGEYGCGVDLPAPVVALTIVDAKTLVDFHIGPNTMMLIVVRDPGCNRTHPNVVSVPTQRVPVCLLNSLLAGCDSKKVSGSSSAKASKRPASNSDCSGHISLIYTVESIFARKLGLADALEADLIHFDAELQLVETGISYHPNLPVPERVHHVIMANILVRVISGAELLPKSTRSYSHIFWATTNKFYSMVEMKDPSILNAELDPLEYCVQGLCIKTSHDLLKPWLRS